MIYYERERVRNVEDLGSSSSSSVLWGRIRRCLGVVHGPMKERKEKKKQGERKGGGHRIRERRRGEGQEVIHRNTGNWRCWGVVLLLKLHHVSFNLLANTANKMRLNDLLWKRKSTRHWGSWFFEFFECIVGKLCRESPKTSNHLRWDFADLRSLRSEWM